MKPFIVALFFCAISALFVVRTEAQSGQVTWSQLVGSFKQTCKFATSLGPQKLYVSSQIQANLPGVVFRMDTRFYVDGGCTKLYLTHTLTSESVISGAPGLRTNLDIAIAQNTVTPATAAAVTAMDLYCGASLPTPPRFLVGAATPLVASCPFIDLPGKMDCRTMFTAMSFSKTTNLLGLAPLSQTDATKSKVSCSRAARQTNTNLIQLKKSSSGGGAGTIRVPQTGGGSASIRALYAITGASAAKVQQVQKQVESSLATAVTRAGMANNPLGKPVTAGIDQVKARTTNTCDLIVSFTVAYSEKDATVQSASNTNALQTAMRRIFGQGLTLTKKVVVVKSSTAPQTKVKTGSGSSAPVNLFNTFVLKGKGITVSTVSSKFATSIQPALASYVGLTANDVSIAAGVKNIYGNPVHIVVVHSVPVAKVSRVRAGIRDTRMLAAALNQKGFAVDTVEIISVGGSAIQPANSGRNGRFGVGGLSGGSDTTKKDAKPLLPWFAWAGIAAGVCLCLICGLFIIKKRKDAEYEALLGNTGQIQFGDAEFQEGSPSDSKLQEHYGNVDHTPHVMVDESGISLPVRNFEARGPILGRNHGPETGNRTFKTAYGGEIKNGVYAGQQKEWKRYNHDEEIERQKRMREGPKSSRRQKDEGARRDRMDTMEEGNYSRNPSVQFLREADRTARKNDKRLNVRDDERIRVHRPGI